MGFYYFSNIGLLARNLHTFGDNIDKLLLLHISELIFLPNVIWVTE